MPDKLDWLNEHFVLLKYRTVAEVVENCRYKVPFELRKTADEHPLAEDFLKQLAEAENYQKASEFLAFNLHQRALAWWGYCCVLSVKNELFEIPFEPRDISDIGTHKNPELPEWAKMPEPEKMDYKTNPDYIKLQQEISAIKAKNEELIKMLPPGIWERHMELRKNIYEKFKSIVGMDPEEMLADAIKKVEEFKEPAFVNEEKSPVFQMKRELDAKIEAIRKKTVETIKAAVPSKSREELKEQTDNAMDAVYAGITAPTDENATRCLNLGNACPETHEGLLSLLTFWCYGNLTPNMEQIVRTPPELPPTGLNSLLLKCALTEGGTREFKERMKLYFEIGREVVFGINNWSEFLTEMEPPHHKIGHGGFTGVIGKVPDDASMKQAAEKALNDAGNKKFERFRG